MLNVHSTSELIVNIISIIILFISIVYGSRPLIQYYITRINSQSSMDNDIKFYKIMIRLLIILNAAILIILGASLFGIKHYILNQISY